MPPVSDAVLEKLKKILARTDTARGATEAEVKTAMAMAQKLAAEHNIDLASVSLEGDVTVGKIDIGAGVVQTKTKYEAPYHLEILAVLNDCFGVRTIYQSYWTAQAQRVITQITFVGEKTDLAIATYCWDWLQTLFPKCWGEYRKQQGLRDSYRSARSYYTGLRSGIVQANRRQVEELPTQSRNRYALVVANKTDLSDQKVKEMFPKLRDSRRSHALDYEAWAGGVTRGRDIKLNGGLSTSSNAGHIN